ncbi:DUF3830 family protein [Streptomyces sp. NBC_01477]|uniref:DUF3830 family protein n=1 Tax=Streptomyces sp. NBC_01477 TaxID=2976015 RepID=UPI002E338238|nr:DUF3830 family protein [Streptomyces sp. NBC_01477]
MSTERRIYLQFDDGTRAVATLAADDAPATCAAIWDALAEPVTEKVMHAMYAGPEIMFGLPEQAHTFDPRALPAENQQVIPGAGDLIWFFQEPGQMAGLTFELWEVGIFYGKGGRVFGPLGWTPCTIFASITEGLAEFAAACAETRVSGVRSLTIGRVE